MISVGRRSLYRADWVHGLSGLGKLVVFSVELSRRLNSVTCPRVPREYFIAFFFKYSFIRASQYDSVEITKKMQPCNRIYYSTVHWRLNFFLAAYRSSSGDLTVFAASGLHTHVVPGRTCVCKPDAANTVRAPDDERYTARNMLSL